MLLYKDQYLSFSGIYYAFADNANEKILTVSHSSEKINKMSKFYNYRKYSSWTKQNFILLCLYINLKNNVTSQHNMIEILNNISKEDIQNLIKFKKNIINYRREVYKDINYINEVFGGDIKYSVILKEYRQENINWFTLWYYVIIKLDKEKLLNSRIYKKLLNKIRVITLYINFNEETFKKIINNIQENLIS